MTYPRPSLDVRFWARVQKTESCWLWTGPLYAGYGRIWSGGQNVQAHRVAYELLVGPVPAGLFVLHRCDVRACVNPAHLYAGTHDDNMADMVTRGRSLAGNSNPARRRPETRPRGDQHHLRRRPDLIKRGTEIAIAKLTPAKVLEIRARAASGSVSIEQIARDYGVTGGAIHCILKGRTWKWVA